MAEGGLVAENSPCRFEGIERGGHRELGFFVARLGPDAAGGEGYGGPPKRLYARPDRAQAQD